MNEPTPSNKRTARALRFLTLVAILVAVFLTASLWWTRVRVPGDIDQQQIDQAIAEITVRRAQLLGSGSIEQLSVAVESAWKALEDPQGKHYYYDSEKRAHQIPLPPPEFRKKHLAVAKLLNDQPTVLAGHARAVTVPDADSGPRSAESGVAERVLRLAGCYRQIAGVACQKQQYPIAVDYAECGLQLLTAIAPVTNLTMLPELQREAERLTEFGKSAAQGFGDWSDIDRMAEKVSAFEATHATFRDTLDVEILGWAGQLDSTSGSWLQRASARRAAYEQLDKLLQAQTIAASQASEKDRYDRVTTIDADLGKRLTYYLECQRRIGDARKTLETARDTSQ
ncbi:MAG: hypothetical protein AAF581_02220 [Planctomycetota bacterium]